MLSEIIVGLQTWIHQFFGCDFNVSVNSLFPLMISTWVFQYQKNTSTTTFLQLLEQRNQELQIFLCMWLFQLHVFHLETVFCWCLAFHLVHNWMLTPLFQILWNILLHDAGSNTYRAVADSYIPVIHITALYLLFMLYIPLKVEFLNHKAILSLFYLFNKYKLIFSICYFKGVR